MIPNDVSDATKVVQIFSVTMYILVAYLSTSWLVYTYKNRKECGLSYFLATPFLLIALHGIIYYIFIVLSWFNIFPMRDFLYDLFAIEGVGGSNLETFLFTQWSAIMRAQAAALIAVFLGFNLAILKLKKPVKKATHENPESKNYGC